MGKVLVWVKIFKNLKSINWFAYTLLLSEHASFRFEMNDLTARVVRLVTNLTRLVANLTKLATR